MKDGMNPYKAGAFTGLLLIVSVYITGHFFGASTSYVRTMGMLKEQAAPIVEKSGTIDIIYYDKYIPIVDWQWMFVTGVFIGSLIASKFYGEFKIVALPSRWKKRFGNSNRKRAIIAFIGGIIAMFGARMAGGCPSGHGLSGLAQLSVSGFIAIASFFGTGIIVAHIIYKKRLF